MQNKPPMRMRREPSARDLAIWADAKRDLADWLYVGFTGRLQVAGHRIIAGWAQPFRHGVVLEIGGGHGQHLQLAAHEYRTYTAIDVDIGFARTLRSRFPRASVVNADASALPVATASVDCVLAIYSFEHLRRLPECLVEVRRALKPAGELLVGLPAEGGLAFGLGRRLTSQRYMEKKYGIDYAAIVGWEHWNTCAEVITMLEQDFAIVERSFVPFAFLPTVQANALVCLRATPRATSEAPARAGTRPWFRG